MKKLIKAAMVLVVGAMLLPGMSRAQTQSVVSMQTELQQLLAEVSSFESQIAAQGGSTASWCYTFNANLSIGMSGSAITALQTALQKNGETVTANGTFDDQTAAAVSGFQDKYASTILTPNGLTNPTGYAGKSTRAELNSLYGCGTITAPVQPIGPEPVVPPISIVNPTSSPTGPEPIIPPITASNPSTPDITSVTAAGAIPEPGYGAAILGVNLPAQNATIVIDAGSASAQTITPVSYNGGGASITFIVPSGTLIGSHTIEVKASGVTSNQFTFSVVGANSNPVVVSVSSPGLLAPGYNAFVQGTNLPTSGATVVIDGGSEYAQMVTPLSYNTGGSISFTIPANLTLGYHLLAIQTNAGTSNAVQFPVVGANSNAVVTGVSTDGLLAPGSNAFVLGANLPTQNATLVIDGGSTYAQTITPTYYNSGASIDFALPSNITLGSHSLAVQTSAGTTNAVTFTVVGGAPTATLSATPSMIAAGQSTTLTWSSAGGATSCTISGTDGYNGNDAWSQSSLAASGSKSITPYSGSQTSYTAQYQIVCNGSTGSSNPATATVDVNPS
jgi:hypothetical protein